MDGAPPAYAPGNPAYVDNTLATQQQQFAAQQQQQIAMQQLQQPSPAHTGHTQSNNNNTSGMQYNKDGVEMVTPLPLLGDMPAYVDCPYCKCVTLTNVVTNHSSTTILVGVVLGIFCICLACIPCITHSWPDVDQFCSRCKKQLTHRPHGGQTAVVAAGVANVPSGYPRRYIPADPNAVPSQYPSTSNAEGNAQDQIQSAPAENWVRLGDAATNK